MAFIDDSGQIGIGTTAPATEVEILNSGADPVLTITGEDDSLYDPQIKLKTGASPAVKFSTGVDAANSNRFVLTPNDGIGGQTDLVMDATTGYIGLNTAPDADTTLYSDHEATNAATARNIWADMTANASSNGTYTNYAGFFRVFAKPDTGVTNSGENAAIIGNAFHYDAGTIASLYGILCRYGNYSAGGDGKTTTYSMGIKLVPYCLEGTIDNLYDIQIQPLQDGEIYTVTNEWCIYSNHAAPSRLVDDLRFDADSKGSVYGAGQDARIDYDGTDLLITPNTVGNGTMKVESAVRLKEISAAEADQAGYGQLWCKNNGGTTELWFTDDSGTDTKIV